MTHDVPSTRAQASLHRALEAALPAGRVDTTDDDVLTVEPHSREELVAVLRVTGDAALAVAVEPHGARGAALLVLTRALPRTLEVDAGSGFARVGGPVTAQELTQAAADDGLFWAPAVGAGSRAVLACVARHERGIYAGAYGTARDSLNSAEVVDRRGQILRYGSLGRKDVTGYDVLHTLVGSRGRLGVLTEVAVRLVRRPIKQRSLSFACSSVQQAVAFAVALHAERLPLARLDVEGNGNAARVHVTILGPNSRVRALGERVLAFGAQRQTEGVTDASANFTDAVPPELVNPYLADRDSLTVRADVAALEAITAELHRAHTDVGIRASVLLGELHVGLTQPDGDARARERVRLTAITHRHRPAHARDAEKSAASALLSERVQRALTGEENA